MKTLLSLTILVGVGLIGLGFVFPRPSSAEVDPTKVIAAFLFDDPDVKDLIRDWSGRRNHAEPNKGNSFRFEDEGKFGGAVELEDGRKLCLDLGKPILNELTEFTFVGWFNRDPAPPWGGYETFIEQSNVIEWYNNRRSSNALLVFPRTKKKPDALKPVQAISKLPGPDNKWTDEGTFVHMSVIADLNQMTVYRNARRPPLAIKKVNNLPERGALVHYGKSDNNTYIGGCGVAANVGGQGDGNWFPGLLDEVAIFGEALELADVKAIMNNGLTSLPLIGLAVKPGGKLATTWGSLKKQY